MTNTRTRYALFLRSDMRVSENPRSSWLTSSAALRLGGEGGLDRKIAQKIRTKKLHRKIALWGQNCGTTSSGFD